MAESTSIISQETNTDGREKDTLANLEPSEGFFATTDLTEEELETEQITWTTKDKDSVLDKENIKAMQTMSLANCNIEKVPLKLCKITGLTRLYLSTNQIKTLPTEFSQLVHLTNLNLDSNKFEKVPEAICMLTKLQVLSMAHNHLTTDGLKNIGKLACLEELNIASNNIKEFPTGICELKELRLLDFRFNFLSALPADINKLKDLTVLLVRRNVLKSLPESISDLKHLKLACFAANHIEYVHFESLIGLPNLMDLCLHANRLKNAVELENNIALFAKQGKLLRVNENRVDISQKLTCDSLYECIRQDVLIIHDGTVEVTTWVEKLTRYLTEQRLSNKSVGPADEKNGKQALYIRRNLNSSRIVVPICTPLLTSMTDTDNKNGKALRNALGELVQKGRLENFLLVFKEPCSLKSNWFAAGGSIDVNSFRFEDDAFAALSEKITKMKGQRLHLASTSLV